MPEQKTHREVKKPQITARYLADYMAASERARRTLVRNCKYQKIARVVQHEEARAAVGRFMRGQLNMDALKAEAEKLRNRLADSDFERDVYDHNADYIVRFAKVASDMQLPKADILTAGKTQPIYLNGVRVNVDIAFLLQRVTKTNKIRIGAATLRYAKGKPLSPAVAEWQSAFLLGFLNETGIDEEAEPEQQLCLTIDAYAGIAYPAPGDAVSRYNNMAAACATIAERWDNVEPPAGAVF